MMTTENNESPVFAFRLQTRDAFRMDAILELDGEVDTRTDAVRAALKHYEKYLRRKAERAAA